VRREPKFAPLRTAKAGSVESASFLRQKRRAASTESNETQSGGRKRMERKELAFESVRLACSFRLESVRGISKWPRHDASGKTASRSRCDKAEPPLKMIL
jgi:hypothetical protein